MKRAYFNSKSFIDEARELVRWSEELGRVSFTPGSTALLVIDMQRYFLEPSSHAYLPSASHVVPRIIELAAAFAAHGLPVVYTRHVNTDTDAGSLGVWWDDLIRPDDPLSELSPEFDTSLGAVVEKHQYDAFHGSGLEDTLRERGATRVVVTGVVTHLCCETTARSAFVRGFEVTLPVDGTATYDEEFHLATLLNLSHGFATVSFVSDLLEKLGNDADRDER